MRLKINLEAEDIGKIIAEKYGVFEGHVRVFTEKRCTGYGPTEKMEPVAVAEVVVEEDKVAAIVKKMEGSGNPRPTTKGVVICHNCGTVHKANNPAERIVQCGCGNKVWVGQ